VRDETQISFVIQGMLIGGLGVDTKVLFHKTFYMFNFFLLTPLCLLLSLVYSSD
jgi:hypothetical protein